MFFNIEDIKNEFHKNLILQKGNDLFEIRIIKSGINGYFSSNEEGINSLIEELKKKNLLNQKITIYQTLQSVKSDVITHDNINRLYKTKHDNYHATADIDIERYKWIFIDLDPIHEADTQIPDSELKYTQEARNKILNELKENGFSKPVVVFSGNGQHIYVPIDEPNTKDTKETIKQFLNILDKKFSNEKFHVDTSIFNPGRITKFIGCWSTKGKDTPETPYRECVLIQEGDDMVNDINIVKEYINKNKGYISSSKVLKKKILKSSDKSSALTESSQPSSTSLDFTNNTIAFKENSDDNKRKYLQIDDVTSYLNKYEIDFNEEDKGEYICYQLSQCPFNEEHNRGECALLQVKQKGVSFHCLHNHCKDKTIFDFVTKYPCGTIPPIDKQSDREKVFNTLVVNGKLIRNKKDYFFFHFRGNTYPLNSEELAVLIRRISLEINQSIPEIKIDSKIIQSLEGYTLDEIYYEQAAIGKRMVLNNNTLYYALNKNRYVIVNANGVSISNSLPDDVYFISTQLESQVEPDFSTKPEELPELLLSICNIDEEQISLLVANILSFFRDDINSPILVLQGSQGSCKSSCARIIRSIIDPDKIDLISFPDKEDGLIAALSNNDICLFDNVEKITETMSSKLCIAVTNGFVNTRKLYTDNTQVSINISSNVILTCIEDVVSQSDLAERSNVIHLERIAVYRTEADMKKQVEQLMPKILGAVFNTLSNIFAIADSIKLDNPPRMADFAEFAMAAIKTVGLSESEFLKLYTNRVKETVSVTASDDPLITCIESIIARSNNGTIEMPSHQLLENINNLHICTNRYSPSSLSRALSARTAEFEAVGITWSKERRGSERVIKLTKNKQIFECNITQEEILDDIEF